MPRCALRECRKEFKIKNPSAGKIYCSISCGEIANARLTVNRNNARSKKKKLDKYERSWAAVLLPNEVPPDSKRIRQAVPEATMLPRRSQKWA